MQGFDLDKVRKLVKLTKNRITIAGGITTIEEVFRVVPLDTGS